jgi:AhpD family alkylhydroperoxidase
MSDIVEEFNDYRAKMNNRILANNNKIIKRIFNLDTNAFQAGALDVKTKELLGLVASAVLRCDDCIKYHLETCHKQGLKKRRTGRNPKHCNPGWWHHRDSTSAPRFRILGSFGATRLNNL